MSQNNITLFFDNMKLAEADFKIQLGITPSRGYVVVPGDEWVMPANGTGTLYVGDSNTAVIIDNLKIERVLTQQGAQGTSLMRVEIKDRRWKWALRTFTGRFNVVISDDDGKVRYDPDTVKAYDPEEENPYTLYSFEDIARQLLIATGESDVADIPIASTSHVPLNKEWENTNPAVALQEICEEIDFGIGLRVSDGRATIVKLGDGAYPSVANQYKINVGVGTSFNDKPDYVKVVGNRIQDEITLALEPVGIDVDGEIRALANLAYCPDPTDADDGTGFGKSALQVKPFANITGGEGYTAKQAQALAEKSVFRYFRIPNTGLFPDDASRENADRLPLLKTLNQLDEQGWRKRPFVRIRQYQKAPAGGFENPATLETPNVSYRIDYRRGLVIFGKRVGVLLAPDALVLSDTKLISQPGDAALTFAHELKGDDDFYYLLRSDQSSPPDPDDATIKTVKRSDLTLRRIEGVDQNKSELDAIADAIADRLLEPSAYSTNTDMQLAGAHAINLNGSIDSVRWHAKDTIVTRLRHGDFEPTPTPASYEERTHLPRIRSYTEDNRRSAERARETNLQGSRQGGDVSADEPGGMEYQTLEIINAHHSGLIIVKDSRDEEEKQNTTYEDVCFAEVTGVDEDTHRHTVANSGPIIDMRYNDYQSDWLKGWVHGSFLDIETTEYEWRNSGDWQHLLDNGGGLSWPYLTRIYYGEVPDPDPMADDVLYHLSQSMDQRKPVGYVPGGVADPNRIRLHGEMRSAPSAPTIFGMDLTAPIGLSPVVIVSPIILQFGAIVVEKQLTYMDVWRAPLDANSTTTPHVYASGMWGLAQFVRFKVFIDPDRT